MDLDTIIRNIVSEVVEQRIGQIASPGDPDMIKLEETATILDVGKSTVEELHRDRATNGFPSVQLGPRTVRVDRRRLNQWTASGGLGANV